MDTSAFANLGTPKVSNCCSSECQGFTLLSLTILSYHPVVYFQLNYKLLPTVSSVYEIAFSTHVNFHKALDTLPVSRQVNIEESLFSL